MMIYFIDIKKQNFLMNIEGNSITNWMCWGVMSKSRDNSMRIRGFQLISILLVCSCCCLSFNFVGWAGFLWMFIYLITNTKFFCLFSLENVIFISHMYSPQKFSSLSFIENLFNRYIMLFTPVRRKYFKILIYRLFRGQNLVNKNFHLKILTFFY